MSATNKSSVATPARKAPARKAPARKAASKAPSAPVAAQTVATPAPTPTPVVAVRGGLVLQAVALVPGKVYKTKAPHNQAWWALLAAACAAGPAAVNPLLATQANPAGVPMHFVGYCVRRGYLQAATLPAGK